MEEEISLRDIIGVVIKGKWVIFSVAAVFVFLAAIFSFFLLSPQYEGRATLMVNQSKMLQPQQGGSSNLDALLQVMSRYPEMTMETYRSQMANPVALKKVIDELKLDPEKYTVAGLQKSIGTEVTKNTNLISIVVKGDNPGDVTRIANSVAVHFVDFISGQSKQQLGQTLVYLKDQMAVEEKNAKDALEEYKNFLSQPGGVQELKAEVEAKIALLTEFKKQLFKNKVEISQTDSALGQLERDMAQTPQKLVTKKSLSEDPYLLQVLGDKTGSSPGKLSGLSMDSEVVNDIYVEMATKRAELRAKLADLTGQQKELQKSIGQLQQQLEQLQVELAENQTVDDRLSQRVNTIRTNYEALSARYEETRLSQSAKMGEANISFIAPAVEPKVPVSPRKMLNMAVAGVLGVMVGVFLVFFQEYWRNTAPRAIDNT